MQLMKAPQLKQQQFLMQKSVDCMDKEILLMCIVCIVQITKETQWNKPFSHLRDHPYYNWLVF